MRNLISKSTCLILHNNAITRIPDQSQKSFILQISAFKFLKIQTISHKILWRNPFFP